MLNLAEASRPQGSVSVAGINGQPLNGVNPSQTSIQLSSVFGQLFRGNAPTLGLIDGYQRAYIFEPALEPAPEYTLSAQEVMQLLKPAQPEPHPLIQSGQMTLQLVSSDASLQGERGMPASRVKSSLSRICQACSCQWAGRNYPAPCCPATSQLALVQGR